MSLLHKALLLFALLLTTAFAQDKIYQGFNSGNTFTNWSAKFEDDFTKEFTTMQNLNNAPEVFNSVRLYTNIQSYTTDDILSAIPAAIKTNTSILLGIWTSGTNNITNELSALGKALDKYGEDLANAVMAISVGSEDMYRLSDVGIRQHAGIGASPEAIVGFLKDTRDFIADTLLKDKPVGHVDAWRAWVNESNSAVIEAVDFVGVDIYPYFENDTSVSALNLENSFNNSIPIFEDRYNATVAAAQGKPVWITETGWPFATEGDVWGQAVASTQNQRDYWRGVGCGELFGKVNTWWYTLRDANPEGKEKFAITEVIGGELSTTARFDLRCPGQPGYGTADEAFAQ